ncbi:putative MFS quinate transporter [Aaosphaeria arxii CBS 175.79]|uniref:Putative MFS quinate transporter n=1 Tax=Aaosphaeria arxii CBS 175.79 TaxID=1450172 RepID=A0A6A5Y8G3_9PLEO|nr:putative MFS quinate transporter [Aaosphaeria arxii CBS 175.79]KAF2020854.1 putative MFS quinate transporter [Aaosphaeria arxii CBS 175.79]
MGRFAPPYYILAVVVLAFGGIPKGYDEGGFSASVTLPAFKADYGLNKNLWVGNATGLANRTANISSFGVLGAAFGALIAYFLNDKIGRLWSYRLAILVWGSGILMQVFSSGIFGFLLFARIWGGLGAGGLTVISPLFLSEIAPTKTRGMIVSMYMVVLLSVLSLGFFVNYGVSKHMAQSRTQWQLVQAIPLIPVGVAFFASWLIPESPRWLASKNRDSDCLSALSRLRGLSPDDTALVAEFERTKLEADALVQMGSISMLETAKECFTESNLRSRFFLAVMLHTVAQWTGGNGITYYISDIFQYAGIHGSETSLITSGAYGLVKLFITMIFAWGLIDKLGRRRCMLAGLTLQGITHIYMAIYFGAIGQGNKSASDAAIASVFIYATGWSIGLCTIPYIYGTEIFPTKARSFAYATTMCLHWFFQFAVVRVTPVMLAALDKWGAYVFWTTICASGIVILGLWAPETKGVPLERMHELFDRPWYKCWNAKLDYRDDSDSAYVEKLGEKDVAEQRQREVAS